MRQIVHGLLLLSLVISSWAHARPDLAQPTATDSRIELNGWSELEPLKLAGTWQLELLEASSGKTYQGPMPVPGIWRRDIPGLAGEFTGYGEATYRLTLRTNRKLDGIALRLPLRTKPKKISVISNSAETVLYDSSDYFDQPESTFPLSNPILLLPPLQGNTELKVRFYNVTSQNGGFSEAPVMYDAQKLLSNKLQEDIVLTISVVTLFFLAAINVTLAFSRSGRWSAACLAIASLSLIVRIAINDSDLGMDLFQGLTVTQAHYAGWLALYFGLTSITTYFYLVFRQFMPNLTLILPAISLAALGLSLPFLSIAEMQLAGEYIRPPLYLSLLIVAAFMVSSVRQSDLRQRFTLLISFCLCLAYALYGFFYEMGGFGPLPLLLYAPAVIFLLSETVQLLIEYRASLKQVNQIVSRNTKLEDMVRRDALTGIPNRRGFEDWCRDNVKFGKRESDLHIFGILDLDNFKNVNDQYGHDVGDEVLKSTANLLASSLRDSDIAARWGGEEFCIMLTNLDRNQALSTLERIRGLIADEPVRAGNQTIQITTSIGVTSVRDQTDLDEAFKRADTALYHAKGAGKNRVVALGLDNQAPAAG